MPSAPLPAALPDVLFLLLGDATGSSRALRQIRWLAAAGYAVAVVGVGPPRDAGALPAGVGLTALPAPPGRGPAFFWRAHRALRAAALRTPARLVLASDLHALPAACAAAERRGARLVYDAREWYAGLDASAGRPLVGATWAAVERHFAPRADAVLTVNDAIADRLAAERRIARPTVVHNVVARPASARTGALRSQIGVGAREPLVLYQGLFRAGRGLEALVRATGAVPGATLVLIGEGDRRDALVALAEDLAPGRVHVLPFTPPDALAALTPDADLGAIPIEPLTESLRLALPNKLFEFAAADVPVLAGTGVVPLREIVERFGAGPVADPADPDALAAALHTGLFDSDARAGYRAGLARLRAAFPPGAEAARFLGVVHALIGTPAR